MTELSLTEKEESLRDTVAFPTKHDWQLLTSDKELEALVVKELNNALGAALAEIKGNECLTWLGIRNTVKRHVQPVRDKYMDLGACDGEGSSTVARFMAVNYCTEMYDFFRHNQE